MKKKLQTFQTQQGDTPTPFWRLHHSRSDQHASYIHITGLSILHCQNPVPAALKMTFYSMNRSIATLHYWKRSSRPAATLMLHDSVLKGFIWYFWRAPRAVQTPCMSGGTLSPQWWKVGGVSGPTKAAQSCRLWLLAPAEDLKTTLQTNCAELTGGLILDVKAQSSSKLYSRADESS